MFRSLTMLAAFAVLSTAAVAVAEETPPPPPPSSDSSDAKEEKSTSSGGSAFKQADALLDASPKSRPMMLSFFANIPYGYFYGCGYYYSGFCGFPFGVSARFDIPLVPNGFLPMLNDSFDIEFGLDLDALIGGTFGVGITPIVGVRWNFFLIPKLAVYPKFELGIGIYPGSFYGGRFYHNEIVGVVYQVTDAISLRAEVGSTAIRAGIGINF